MRFHRRHMENTHGQTASSLCARLLAVSIFLWGGEGMYGSERVWAVSVFGPMWVDIMFHVAVRWLGTRLTSYSVSRSHTGRQQCVPSHLRYTLSHPKMLKWHTFKKPFLLFNGLETDFTLLEYFQQAVYSQTRHNSENSISVSKSSRQHHNTQGCPQLASCLNS